MYRTGTYFTASSDYIHNAIYDRTIHKLLEMWLETSVTLYKMDFAPDEVLITIAYSEQLEEELNLLSMKYNLEVYTGNNELNISLPLSNH